MYKLAVVSNTLERLTTQHSNGLGLSQSIHSTTTGRWLCGLTSVNNFSPYFLCQLKQCSQKYINVICDVYMAVVLSLEVVELEILSSISSPSPSYSHRCASSMSSISASPFSEHMASFILFDVHSLATRSRVSRRLSMKRKHFSVVLRASVPFET